MSTTPKSEASPPFVVAPWPRVDFAAYGEIERRPLTRIQKLVGSALVRNWTMIPHVTHHDLADATALDAARDALSQASGQRITPLAYLVRAAVAALQAYPHFNASLDEDGGGLIFKKYFHIGVAVDTPTGLLVPVIRDADRKSVTEIAAEIAEVSDLARSKGLPLDRMSGGSFSISSLGSIGGTGFTPIINAPEVAIMGVARAVRMPVEREGGLQWRSMLPLSLSYDHRVINGADAARFCRRFADALAQAATLT